MESPHCYKLADYYQKQGLSIYSVSEIEPQKKISAVKYHYFISRKSVFYFFYKTFNYLINKLLGKLGQVIYYELFLSTIGYYRYVKQIKTDLVHAHFASTGGIVALKSVKSNYLLSCWGSDILLHPFESKYFRKKIGQVLKNAKIIHTSSYHLDEVIKIIYHINSNKIFHKQYGLSYSTINFFNKYKKQKDNKFIAIITRSAKKVYDNETIINAAKIVQSNNCDAKFIMISGGPLHNKYKKMIKKMNLKNIELYNSMPQHKLFTYMKKANYYISASLSDGLSISLLEAFAAKLYPIVSDIKANSILINDKQNGRLFLCREAEQLANIILELYNENLNFQQCVDFNYKWLLKNQVLEENLKKIGAILYKI